jgi:hypothetical protein
MKLRTVLFQEAKAQTMTCREQTGLSGLFQLAPCRPIVAEIVCVAATGSQGDLQPPKIPP